MNWTRSNRLAAFCGTATVCISAAARAGTQEETFTESFTVANIGAFRNVDIPQFDPQGGCRELLKVTLAAEGVGTGDYSFTNDSDTVCTGTVTLNYGATVTFPFPSGPPPILECSQFDSVGPIPILLNPDETLDLPGIIDFQFSCMDMTDPGEDLSPFIGMGTIVARYDGDQDSDREVDCDFTDSLDTDFAGTITITYEFMVVENEACCLPSGDCIEICPIDCADMGGTPLGPDSTCGPTGACCLDDGSCIVTTEECCEVLFGGAFADPGTDCEPVGACCFDDGSCEVLSEECCLLEGGEFQGSGTDCDPDPCGRGACCLPDGSCVDDVSQQECEDPGGLNGIYQGDDVQCGDLESSTMIWAVSDPGTADTQLFVVLDLDALQLETVGPVYAEADIEGMTFFDDEVVGSMGDTSSEATLMTMDFVNGDLAFFADLDFGGPSSEIVGMASDDNGVHWAYMQDIGFATIEVTGSVASFSVEVDCDVIDDLDISCGAIEGLAVSPDGQTLYAMSKYGEIVEIDTSSGNASLLDDIGDLFGDDDIENLELYSENELAFITEHGDDLEFSIYDIITGEISTVVFQDTSLDDIESLVIVPGSGCPEPLGACFYGENECARMSESECEAAGGEYQGDLSQCSPPCPADLDGDGSVGVTDFLSLLGAWGSSLNFPPDLDGDGLVGSTDFLMLLAAWGPCP